MRASVKRFSALGLSAVMLAAVQVAANAPAAQAAVGIRFSQLLNGERLSDGDMIQATDMPGGVDSGVIKIQLKLAGVSWWKGIQSGPIVLCQAQDNQTSSAAQFSVSDFRAHGLQLWKAKTFGVHTQMYNVVDATQQMSGGHTYVFVWERD